MALIRKGLQFDDSITEQAHALKLLSLAGRKQSTMLAVLLENFIVSNEIDIENVSKEELTAAIINESRLSGRHVQFTPTANAASDLKSLHKDSNPVTTDDDDDIDESMASMLSMFG